MTRGRAQFGPVRVAWTDAAHGTDPSADMLARFGEQQVQRHAALEGLAAQRFLAGRRLLAELIADLAGIDDPAAANFTTTCERCGQPHGRPRLDGAVVSISSSGSVVAVAASSTADAAAVGIDIERLPDGPSSERRLLDLARLFAPAPPPDLEGWTLVEAALKADGRGITVDLADVRIGDVGSGRMPGSRAIRIPGRDRPIDASAVPGPTGFVLIAAMVPAGRP